ncbi:type II secretion system protein [Rugamonas aquatica]|uniref:Prepilin-type N-terminal cleavage/methylation domain-containing protein n=1 Tax=Rugamonas aquatica TaxID=2743357 RepID=A0A6A7N6Y7_9BURK|nr:type II secretion system protein [Rugamonas aquatica]MQA40769.1 prepilin-type N-terminal cleavage/methylation domain-containing protein [Rugamonas aquatica]
MMKRHQQTGVTLVELIVAVMVLGILSIAVSPILNSYVASMRGSYARKQEVNNQTIGIALLQYAHDSTALGTLPPPYTGAGYSSTVFNPLDASAAGLALAGALTQSGVNPSELNDDNYPAHRVRVYQRVDGLVAAWPLYFQSGPQVVLTYQFGVVYMSACERTAACNPSAASGVPGDSAALTATNYGNWSTSGGDLAPFFVSTLPLQKQMLANTAQKLDRIRDAMLSYFRAQQNTASGNDPSNWWLPNPGTMTVAPASVPANQGCHDGWYDLSSTDVLAGIGLSKEEYGTTAWGGAIEYCRDYDADGSKAANAAPHYAALRINRNVSAGDRPDAGVVGNNLLLTF